MPCRGAQGTKLILRGCMWNNRGGGVGFGWTELDSQGVDYGLQRGEVHGGFQGVFYP